VHLRWGRFDDTKIDHTEMKVRKTQEGGWIVLVFSSFSPTEVTGQKQLDYNFWSDVQILNAADKNRERERERERRRRRTHCVWIE